MNRDRQERVKELGRIAFRLARFEDIRGYIECKTQRLRIREYRNDLFEITLLEAANREPSDLEISELKIEHARRRVLEIRWSAAGYFKTVHFEPGSWEDDLRGLPDNEPIPFE